MGGVVNPIHEVLTSYIVSRKHQLQEEAQRPLSPKLVHQTKQIVKQKLNVDNPSAQQASQFENPAQPQQQQKR